MELIACTVCGMEVGDYNSTCPYCGSILARGPIQKRTVGSGTLLTKDAEEHDFSVENDKGAPSVPKRSL